MKIMIAMVMILLIRVYANNIDGDNNYGGDSDDDGDNNRYNKKRSDVDNDCH